MASPPGGPGGPGGPGPGPTTTITLPGTTITLPPPDTTSSSTTTTSSTPLTTPTLTTTSTSSTTTSTSSIPIITSLPTTNVGTSTVLTTVVATASTPTPTATKASSSTPFLKNTGAVAGVFSVAGLIGLAILTILVTTCVRRRRAARFDREVADAAAEAARTQVVLDDDDYNDPYARHGSSGAGTVYSDGSNGAYAQPPMMPGQGDYDYGMRQHQGYPVAAAGMAGGAAGVGAMMSRARSMREMQNDPYGQQQQYPGYGQPHPQDTYIDAAGVLRYRSPPPAERGASPPGMQRGPSTRTDYSSSNASRQRSIPHSQSPPESYYTGPTSNDSYGQRNMTGQEQYANHYQRGYQPDNAYNGYPGPDPRPQSPPKPAPNPALDPYGGYVEDQRSAPRPMSAQMPNPHDSDEPSSNEGHHEEPAPDYVSNEHHSDGPSRPAFLGETDPRASFRDEEDYEMERANRVLKVANE